ncbi:MAG: Serine/arginine-rich splicing factor 6 [Marteilia pararefringens]
MVSSSAAVPRIYVGNLSRHAIEKDLWQLFDPYRPASVHLKQGFAFIDFDSRRDCSDALKDLNNCRICDLRIRLELAKNHEKPRPMRSRISRSQYKLIVKNISSRLNWKDLKNFFRRWVEVAHADCNDHIPGTGEVYFDNKEDMKYAYRRIHGELFYGKPVKLVLDSDHHDRSRSWSPVHSRKKTSTRRRSHSSESRHSRKRSVASNKSYSVSPRSAHSRNGTRGKRSVSYESYVTQSSGAEPDLKRHKHEGSDYGDHAATDPENMSKEYSSQGSRRNSRLKKNRNYHTDDSCDENQIIIPKVAAFSSNFANLQKISFFASSFPIDIVGIC